MAISATGYRDGGPGRHGSARSRRRSNRLRAPLRRITLTAGLFFLLWLTYVAFVLQPSNDRDWEFGMATLPRITMRDGSVLVQNVRDFRYTAEGTRSSEYVDRAFEVERIERAWLVEEPFRIAPFTGFEGVAHTYFVFDFQDRPPVAISVESRREKGETYDAIRGSFNEYELIYIWGTEEDLTGRRAVLEKNPLYMYPITASTESIRELFLQLARTSQELESRPRFYNTLTSNCTNELAKAANKVNPDAIPPNRALVFPGYSDEVLYELGFIPNDAPLEEISRRYYITDVAVVNYEKDGFSRLLRTELERRAAGARPAARLGGTLD
jgi:hypothetical protein